MEIFVKKIIYMFSLFQIFDYDLIIGSHT